MHFKGGFERGISEGGTNGVALGAAPASLNDSRKAVTLATLLLVTFVAAVPWATQPLPAIPALIPAYNVAFVVLALITALLLIAQYRQLGERSFLALACGYLFCSILVAGHALSFPGAFVNGILLGGAQTSAWLWTGWHGIFPLFIAAYAVLARYERRSGRAGPREIASTRKWVIVTVTLAVLAVLLCVTAEPLLPELLSGNRYSSSITEVIVLSGWLAHVAALVLVIRFTRLRRLIDLCIAITLLAWMFDVTLSALLITGRYQLGWYMGRLYGLLGSCFLLLLILRETVELYANAVASATRLRETAEYLNFTFDAFEAAEWDVDVRSGEIRHSPRLSLIFGYPHEQRLTLSHCRDRYHPEDRDKILEIPRRAEEFGESRFEVEFRIVRSGEDVRWLLCRGQVLLDPGGKAERSRGAVIDITEQKRFERDLQRSEERQAFLLKLADALRPLLSPSEIQSAASRLIGEHLKVSRTFYADIEGEIGKEQGVVRGEYTCAGRRLPRRFDYAPFGEAIVSSLRRGETLVVNDAATDPRCGEAERAAYRQAEIAACIAVTLVKGERWVATFGVRSESPRYWTSDEVALVREVAERTWAAVERAKAEAALRESEQRLRLALAASRMGIWTWDIKSDLQLRDARLNSLLGIDSVETQEPFESFLGKHVHPEDRRVVREVFHHAATEGHRINMEFRVVLPKGTECWLRTQGDVSRTDGNTASHMAGACVDISDLKAADRALREARDLLEDRVVARTAELARVNETLRAEVLKRERVEAVRTELLRKLVTAQEDGRRRVSRELHDVLGQELTALILGLKRLEQQLPKESSLYIFVREVEAAVERIGREAHDLAIDLRPTALDDLGLRSALEAHVVRWREWAGVNTEFEFAGSEQDKVPAEIATAVYRIIQEALNNVAKHAGATDVSVIVKKHKDAITAVVEDNGKGFDYSSESLKGDGERLGVLGMKERVALVGGTLLIESHPGGGTLVRTRIPLTPPAAP